MGPSLDNFNALHQKRVHKKSGSTPDDCPLVIEGPISAFDANIKIETADATAFLNMSLLCEINTSCANCKPLLGRETAAERLVERNQIGGNIAARFHERLFKSQKRALGINNRSKILKTLLVEIL